jgi:hypothetical protein
LSSGKQKCHQLWVASAKVLPTFAVIVKSGEEIRKAGSEQVVAVLPFCGFAGKRVFLPQFASTAPGGK